MSERWKTIRDGMPKHEEVEDTTVVELIHADPDTAKHRLAVMMLINKLHEEVGEIAEKPFDVSEYADVHQVLIDLAAMNGISQGEIEIARQRKFEERGGFSQLRTIIRDERADEAEKEARLQEMTKSNLQSRRRKSTISENLEKLLKNLRPATEEELRAQRESWVRGEAGIGDDAEEAAWRDATARGDQAELDRLEARAKRRIEIAEEMLVKSS